MFYLETLFLAGAPYIYIWLVWFVFKLDFPLGTDNLWKLFAPYLLVLLFICVPNLLVVRIASKSAVPLNRLVCFGMVVKLAHAPVCIAVMILAVLLAVMMFLFGGAILAVVLIAMFYPFLYVSSAYGLNALKQCEKHHLFDESFIRKHTKYHRIPLLDELSSILLYRKLKNEIPETAEL